MVGLENADIVLASNSPRRKQLLGGLGFNFRIQSANVDEKYPSDLKGSEIPIYLSRQKADSIGVVKDNTIIIAADTIVWAGDKVLGKPMDAAQAQEMLHILSGNTHKVITGVTIKDKNKSNSFFEETSVTFYNLTDEEIAHYVRNFRPFDKAGAYGIQEWIGMIGVKSISGSFYNVMGLPVARLWHELKRNICK